MAAPGGGLAEVIPGRPAGWADRGAASRWREVWAIEGLATGSSQRDTSAVSTCPCPRPSPLHPRSLHPFPPVPVLETSQDKSCQEGGCCQAHDSASLVPSGLGRRRRRGLDWIICGVPLQFLDLLWQGEGGRAPSPPLGWSVMIFCPQPQCQPP